MANTEVPIEQEILVELDFLGSMGYKIFLCPFIGRTKNQMVGYVLTYVIVVCVTTQLFLTFFQTGTSDWLELINIFPNFGVCVMTLIKYTKIQTHKQLYHDVFYHFRNDMWDVVSSESQSHRKIVRRYRRITMIINRFLLYYSIPLTVVVDSFPYVIMVYKHRVLGKELDHLYPFDGWYPFDKVKWYAVAYLWESFMTAVVICVYGFSNMIHASYIAFTCMELKILGNCFEELISPEDVINIKAGRNVEEIHNTTLKKLKIIIAKHQFLAKKTSALDAVLGDAMLLNYSLGAVFICLTAFTFTVYNFSTLILQKSTQVVDSLYKSVRYFFMFTSLLVEIFNQCFIGQILSDHSEDLTESIYSSDWPYAGSEAKKIMLMFMMYTQKPFKLTGNGYIVMNMNTFSSICSQSYQYFNLLRTVFILK